MMRRGFTLMEVMISVMIMALIITYLYQSVDVLTGSNEQLERKTLKRDAETRVKKLFILDILQAFPGSVRIQRTDEKDIDLFTLTTRNSLHGIGNPKVAYLVDRRDRRLIRIEGVDLKLPVTRDGVYRVRYDTVMEEIEYFKVYESEPKGTLLIILKSRGEALEFFEVLSPPA